MVLAYFLDPVADRLEALGLSRVMATVLILVAFVIVLALGLVILIPILAHQLSDFVGRLPEYLTPAAGTVHQLQSRMAAAALRRRSGQTSRRA